MHGLWGGKKMGILGGGGGGGGGILPTHPLRESEDNRALLDSDGCSITRSLDDRADA